MVFYSEDLQRKANICVQAAEGTGVLDVVLLSAAAFFGDLWQICF